MSRILFMVLGLAAFAATAWADESKIKLADGPGKDLVAQNCSGCHSLDYPQMNSPFLNAKGWEAEVNKMRKAFGAPVPEADVPGIVQYLTAHYGANK